MQIRITEEFRENIKFFTDPFVLVYGLLQNIFTYIIFTLALLFYGFIESFNWKLAYNNTPTISESFEFTEISYFEILMYAYAVSGGIFLNRIFRKDTFIHKLLLFGLPFAALVYIASLEDAELVLDHHALLLVVFAILAYSLLGAIIVLVCGQIYEKRLKQYIKIL